MIKTPVKETARKVLYATLQAIKKNGGEMQRQDIHKELSKKIKFTPYEKDLNKQGRVRWKSVLQWYSIDAVKSGFLIKNQGLWILTKEGEKILSKGETALFEATTAGYKKWVAEHNSEPTEAKIEQEAAPDIEEIQDQALTGIAEYVRAKDPYEFQNLVAALLRAMGLYVAHVAPKGPDGGIDIVAYKDPLAAIPPTVKVQVKHRPDKALEADVVRSLSGIINGDNELGLIVTSGSFTAGAHKEGRNSKNRIRLIDFKELIKLWISYYEKMTEEDKRHLPIVPVYFVKPNEVE